MNLMDLMAKLTLDSSEYESGLSKSQKSAKNFSTNIKKGFGTAVKSATAIVGSASAVAGGFAKMATKTAETGDHIDKMSQKIGMSAKSYQEWDYVMKRAGGSVDSLKAGMKTLNKQATSNSDAFKKLGISQEQVKNLSKEDLFNEVVKGLSSMEDSAERSALATQLLGKAGLDMAPLFNQGTKEIEKQMKMADKYGMVMSDKTVKASAKFKDSMTTLGKTMDGVKNGLMGQFLPSMTKVTDGLALVFAGDTEKGVKKIEKGIDQFLKTMDKVAPKFLDMGAKIISALANGIIEHMPQLADQGIKIITSLIQYITESFPKLFDMGIKVIGAVGEGLLNALPDIIAMLPTMLEQIGAVLSSYDWMAIGGQIVLALGEALKAILPVGVQIFQMLLNGVITVLGELWKRVVEYGGKIVSDLGKKLSQIPKKAVEYFNKLRTNASKAMAKFKSTLSNSAKGAVNAFVKFLKNLPSKAMGAIQGVVTKAKEWGADIVKGIGDGIKNAIANLTAPLTSVAEKIKSFLHFSEPDIGPLSDFHTYMPDMIDLMIKGLNENKNRLGDALEAMANELTEPLDLEASFAPIDYNFAQGDVDTEIITNDRTLDGIADMLGEYLPQLLKAMDVNVYLDKRVLVGQLVPAMDSELGRVTNRKNRGA